MESLWLNKKNNSKLIVIFNGWGMNETPFKHLLFDDFDVLILCDYRKLDFDFKAIKLEEYKEKYLLAWSMGVYVSGLFENVLNNFNKKIAINGTGLIVDDNFGIPVKIYNATTKFLSEESLEKFKLNMFDKAKLNPEITITRDIKGLREELTAIKNLKINGTIKFDRAIISKSDRIIPPKNQLNYWKDKTEIVEIKSTHCPFGEYQTFKEILWN